MRSFEIQNYEKFRNTLFSFGNVKEVAKNLGVHHSMVSNWLKGTHKPNSENIEKILNVYNLDCEDIGAIELKIDIINKHIGERILELLKEKNMTQQQLANELKSKSGKPLSKGTVSSWINGRFMPSDYYMQQLSKFFNVSISFLRKDTDIRNPDNEAICEKMSITENAFKGLENLKQFLANPIDEFGEMHIDTKYSEIISLIISNVDFWTTVINEVSTIISYYTNSSYHSSCNMFLTSDGKTPTNITMVDVSKLNISQSIINIIDNYVETKIDKLNLTKIDDELELLKIATISKSKRNQL